MRLALFGATGTVGTQLLRQSVDTGHEVSALVRDPARLGSSDASADVVYGDVRDIAVVRKTVAGCDAVLSALGGSSPASPDILRVGTAKILEAMADESVTRVVVVQGFHLPYDGDPGNPGQRLIRRIIRVVNSQLFEDSMSLPEVLAGSSSDWTLVRAPRIKPARGHGRYRTGRLRLGPWNSVDAGDVAKFMLACLTDPATVRNAPMISG